jgi:hypothetical protein
VITKPIPRTTPRGQLEPTVFKVTKDEKAFHPFTTDLVNDELDFDPDFKKRKQECLLKNPLLKNLCEPAPPLYKYEYDLDNISSQRWYLMNFVNYYIRPHQRNFVSSDDLFDTYKLSVCTCMHKNHFFKELESMMKSVNLKVNKTKRHQEGRGYVGIKIEEPLLNRDTLLNYKTGQEGVQEGFNEKSKEKAISFS